MQNFVFATEFSQIDMHLTVLGINHRTAPVEVRSQVAFPPESVGQALTELGYLDQATLDQAITEQIVELQDALRQANRRLEQRVQERTAELEHALTKLAELNQLKSNFISNISHDAFNALLMGCL